jgi:malonyl-CoA/methylmalonyl-CoA synthetase
VRCGAGMGGFWAGYTPLSTDARLPALRYPWPVSRGPLLDTFDATLVRRAGAPALDVGPAGGRVQTLTFGEIGARSRRTATALAARGLRAGDRLAVQIANRLEFLDLFLACLRLRVIFVPVNVLYREREVSHIVGDAEPVAVVTTPDLGGFVPSGTPAWDVDELAREAARLSPQPGVARALVIPRDSDGTGPEGSAGVADPSSPDSDGAPRDDSHADGAPRDDTPAAIVYTSGTTGRAKGAVLSHGNLAANARTLVEAWRISAEDRYLAVLPLFHVHGLGNGVGSWLASGCRMRLVERFEHDKAEALFEEFRPTLFFGVPTVYVRLLELPAEASRRIGERMRLFVSGSAPLPASVFEAFRGRFGRAILERYGMSETLMTIGNPYDGERRPGTVGRPLPGVEVRIVGSDDRDLPAGEAGQLLVRGPTVFGGYWRRPEATAAAFVEGWFRTGDLAERSADGYVTLRGRASDLVVSGGFNVYPREIEDVLLEQPGVREAAVFGVPDARRGEVPLACFAGEADPVALEAACRRLLASFKVPRSFVRVEALPRNAMGKVDKRRLREGLSPRDDP